MRRADVLSIDFTGVRSPLQINFAGVPLYFLDGRAVLYKEDCRDVLKTIPDNSIDSIVCDPPYHLQSIVKRFGGKNSAPAQFGSDGAFARASRGFMGKTWDGGNIACDPAVWTEALRVLKPGGHLCVFGGTRTYHRMACAIEDAGFEIRDKFAWVYGQGFPKSRNVSKEIDKAAGAEREKVGDGPYAARKPRGSVGVNSVGLSTSPGHTITAAAKQWHGWGTALRPGYENIVLAQKPHDFWVDYGVIGSQIHDLEVNLWSLLPANVAEKSFKLNRREFDEVCASALWGAGERSSTRAALCALMDMPLFVLALTSCLNTVSLWKDTWVEGSQPENMSTTEMELKTTIDLRTLKSYLSKITPESIMLAHKSGLWSIANASIVERAFNASVLRLASILELSALAPAITKAADDCRDVGDSPLFSSICLARKPLSEKTVAANVMKWGTGALNIDGCRITTSEDDSIYAKNPHTHSGFGHANAQVYGRGKGSDYRLSSGRWPANLVHDGSEEVLDGFPAARSAGNYPSSSIGTGKGTTYLPLKPQGKLYSDSGSAARFFYCAKASKRDRRGSKHPTIKPVKLIQWLVRLVTPPNGTVLDIFAGSGTTGEAAYLEGFSAVLIELEAEYQADIKHRIEAMFNENEHLTKLKKIAKEFPDMEFKCQFP